MSKDVSLGELGGVSCVTQSKQRNQGELRYPSRKARTMEVALPRLRKQAENGSHSVGSLHMV